MKRKLRIGSAVVAGVVGLLAAPAGAAHDHFLRTPDGGCHQVASGSTARHHHFHEQVHEGVGKYGGPLDPNVQENRVGLSTTGC